STNTEYMDGFQYTDGILDFFPHAEGYVKATPAGLGGNSTYTFNYVFNYTDHLGNIRLRFTEHPQTGETKILEENHYYPYGLTHKGYNGQHSVVGIGNMSSYITIVPVTPLLADSYKYKFGGKEIQTEFDINTYDFGARNYDPALGRWMNLDPLAEAMRRHSPYNYAFNNPNYFIDPDGMAPIPGGAFVSDTKYLGTSDTSTGGFGGFDVRTFDKDGNTLDSVTVNSNQGVDINADGDITKNDLQTPGDGELSLETAENNSGLNSNDPPSRWQKIFKSFRQTADISTCLSGLSGTAQVGMLEYRKSLPIENKIGTFSRFSSTYIGLGKVTRIGGNIGNVATLGGIYYDYTEMTSGNISQTRFAFRTTSVFASLGTSIAVGSAYGGPYGAAGGALVGAAFVGAEIFYDWWNSNITPQINRSFQFNINGLMHGFRP
ncbi:RHS repeat protein, partial [Aequorivita viscosa]